ncbi:hypothetical protein HFP15_28530 [Amycolatopsis sp. K13G38]|uniref:Restriction endonuclease domain-containing protein n=1 Tax=Amycolatopsis acididurans TaxID=2724524 RepID=A0ABX1JBF6_9PSEU|nr:hypothetical protein [Amycolatopsis acididurans]NKQ56824.1 hypothetical protein [Amycolatopsis acididurans]
MSTAFMDSALSWDDLLDTWRELAVPEGWRPELTVEGIHMTPPPGGPHNLIADQLHRALIAVAPDDCGIFPTQGKTIRVPFGKPIKIGSPFDVELDTSKF